MHADPDAMAAEVARVCGPAEAAGYRRYSPTSPSSTGCRCAPSSTATSTPRSDLLGPELARLARAAASAGSPRHVGEYFADDRLRRLFSFQALYAGRLAVPARSPPTP